MSQNGRRLLAAAVFSGIMGSGYLLMKLTVPDKERLLERMSDDLKNEQRLNKIEKQNVQLMEVIKRNIESDDPVWKIKALGENKGQ